VKTKQELGEALNHAYEMERLNKSIIGNSGFLPEDPSSNRTSEVGKSARSSNILAGMEETKEKVNN
jgi:hypothetical protein